MVGNKDNIDVTQIHDGYTLTMIDNVVRNLTNIIREGRMYLHVLRNDIQEFLHPINVICYNQGTSLINMQTQTILINMTI